MSCLFCLTENERKKKKKNHLDKLVFLSRPFTAPLLSCLSRLLFLQEPHYHFIEFYLGFCSFHFQDVVGIVAKLSECIALRGASLHSVDVFVPENKCVFYSRSEFAFVPACWLRNVTDNDFMNLSKYFNAEKSIVRVPDLDPKYKIAVFASKQDHCLVDWLHRWHEGRLPVDINCVISFLSKRFLESYNKDIINIHHGLLPSFKGGNPSIQAYDAGVKLIGAATHFVTEELDADPIIEQMVERVSRRDALESFVQKPENLEKQCLSKAVKSYCELRVLSSELNRTVVF